MLKLYDWVYVDVGAGDQRLGFVTGFINDSTGSYIQILIGGNTYVHAPRHMIISEDQAIVMAVAHGLL